MRAVLIGAGVLAGLLLQCGDVQAQGMLPKAEIEKQIREGFKQLVEQSPSETIKYPADAEDDAVICKLTYKKLVTDPKKIAKALGKQVAKDQQIPEQLIEQHIQMYLPQITKLLNEFLADMGEFEAFKKIKMRSKKIPVGKHRIGLMFKGEKPVAVLIFNKDKKKMKKAVRIKMKTKTVKLQENLTMELKEPGKKTKKKLKGKTGIVIWVSCLRSKAKGKKPLVVAKK